MTETKGLDKRLEEAIRRNDVSEVLHVKKQQFYEIISWYSCNETKS